MDFQVSYAQNREDFLIAAFFPDVEAGHYVDVGAGHPEEQSVTKLLYDRGWSGINIEPIPELAAALRAERPRDLTLQVALAATAGEATFRQYTGWGLSTLNAEMAAEHQAHPTSWTDEYTEYNVETVTLAGVLEEHPLPHAHVFKVDVEGAEYDVLSGVDWDRFKPDLVCIETEHIREDWYPILHSAGYEQVFHDGLNAYLLSSEARHRAAHFNYAETVLNGPTIVTPAEAAELGAAPQLRAEVADAQHATATAELGTKRAQLATKRAQLEAQAEIDRLRASLTDLTTAVADRDAAIAELDATATDLTQAVATEAELRTMYAERYAAAASQLAATEAYLADILSSTSWRLTYPLRRALEIARTRIPRRILVRVWRRFRGRQQTVRAGERHQPVDQPALSPAGSQTLARMQALDPSRREVT
jgi:FkbM family methyltransferase